MTDPNTLASRIARMEESDFEHSREKRHEALVSKRADDKYREHLRQLAESKGDE